MKCWRLAEQYLVSTHLCTSHSLRYLYFLRMHPCLSSPSPNGGRMAAGRTTISLSARIFPARNCKSERGELGHPAAGCRVLTDWSRCGRPAPRSCVSRRSERSSGTFAAALTSTDTRRPCTATESRKSMEEKSSRWTSEPPLLLRLMLAVDSAGTCGLMDSYRTAEQKRR